MANRKISDLAALTAPASGDLLPIVDISEAAAANKNKKITYSGLLNNIPTGTITSTMILDGTILNADINASAAIADTKLATIATAGKVSNSATTATNANTPSGIVARDASGNFAAGTITAALTGAASSNVLKAGDTMTGVLVVTAGTAALPGIAVSGDLNTGITSPGPDQLAISTSGTTKVLFDNTTAPLKEIFSSVYYPVATQVDIGTSPNQVPLNGYLGTLAFQDSVSVSVGGILANGLSGIGYAVGAGLAVTQITSRTTGVTINAPTGAITLVSAAGSTTYQTFTVTNSTVAATDVIMVSQKSGTDKYAIWVTAVAAGSFALTFATLAGTTTEQPVFNFAVIKAVSS